MNKSPANLQTAINLKAKFFENDVGNKSQVVFDNISKYG